MEIKREGKGSLEGKAVKRKQNSGYKKGKSDPILSPMYSG